MSVRSGGVMPLFFTIQTLKPSAYPATVFRTEAWIRKVSTHHWCCARLFWRIAPFALLFDCPLTRSL